MYFSLRIKSHKLLTCMRKYSTQEEALEKFTVLNNVKYSFDDFTNVTPKILSFIGKNLHNKPYHPLNLMKQRIVNYFYSSFKGRTGKPIFSIFDNLDASVSVEQNFDSLLIPEDHVSRKKSDCFYLNRKYLLRAHMTAHQSELIGMGLDNFLMFGDVYRRDEIDSTHYPVFHQCDAVRLFHREQLAELTQTEIFERGIENDDKQAQHTLIASREIEQQLKSTLEGLARHIFGKETECRWVGAYFPFTHPSWELEVKRGDTWLEVLGCGIIRHDILVKAGADNQLGWAFGLGLDRLAMIVHAIPDIRLFWSEDPGFFVQFQNKTVDDKIIYKPISIYPSCKSDVSFWIPENYEENDFHSLVREIGGDLIEQTNLWEPFRYWLPLFSFKDGDCLCVVIKAASIGLQTVRKQVKSHSKLFKYIQFEVYIIDKFTHPKTGKSSRCYRITYRDLRKTLTQSEVNEVHGKISHEAEKNLGVKIR